MNFSQKEKSYHRKRKQSTEIMQGSRTNQKMDGAWHLAYFTIFFLSYCFPDAICPFASGASDSGFLRKNARIMPTAAKLPATMNAILTP